MWKVIILLSSIKILTIQYETKAKEMNDVIHVFQEFNMREINWINNFKWKKLFD